MGGHVVIDMAYPLGFIAVFGEGLFMPGNSRQVAVNIKVVPALALWRQGLVHGHHKTVARGAADIVALQRGGGRQNDVRATRRGRPPAVVHHHGLRLLPGAHQTVQILVMVKRVATRPVNHLDIGVHRFTAVELVRLAGLQEHVGDTGDRNGQPRGVVTSRHLQTRHIGPRIPNTVHGAVPESKTATG